MKAKLHFTSELAFFQASKGRFCEEKKHDP